EADLAALARAAARLDAARYVLAELPDHLRGRAPGAVPALLRLAPVSEAAPEDAIEDAPDPVAATRPALARATAGDLLVLLVLSHRDEALALVRAAAAAARR